MPFCISSSQMVKQHSDTQLFTLEAKVRLQTSLDDVQYHRGFALGGE